jgi:guanylate kinase
MCYSLYMEKVLPSLQNKQAFQEALKNYEVSPHGKEVLNKTPFVALSGIAGGGRNTVIRVLVETGKYIFAVSDTTRPPKVRDGRLEVDGVDYYFRDEAAMLQDIQSGEFIEAEIIHNQQVSGTSIREIERTIATGKIPIHDFEYGGIKNVVKAKPDAVIIGLVPPNYDEWIRRLYNREPLHDQEFLNRLVTAEKVLENMLAHPYFKLLVNDSTEECTEQLRRIVEDGNYTDEEHARGRRVVEGLLEAVKKGLSERLPA